MFNRRWRISAGIAILCAAVYWLASNGVDNLNAEIRSKSGEFNQTVGANVWTGIHFKNMNAGAILEVSGSSSSRLPVYLLAGTEASFTRGEGEALVALVSENTFEFSIQIPADGDYMLVLDNREGNAAVDFNIDASASLATD